MITGVDFEEIVTSPTNELLDRWVSDKEISHFVLPESTPIPVGDRV